MEISHPLFGSSQTTTYCVREVNLCPCVKRVKKTVRWCAVQQFQVLPMSYAFRSENFRVLLFHYQESPDSRAALHVVSGSPQRIHMCRTVFPQVIPQVPIEKPRRWVQV